MIAAQQRGGLLVHLLEHEVLVAALLGSLDRPVDLGHQPLARRAVDAGDRHTLGRDVGDVALLEEDDALGVGQDGGDVRGEEVLALADADDERHVHARADQPVRLARVHDRDRVRAVRLAQRARTASARSPSIGLFDEVRERLRVGVGSEHVAALAQAVAQLA